MSFRNRIYYIRIKFYEENGTEMQVQDERNDMKFPTVKEECVHTFLNDC